ncbi:hypothetical protein [Oceanivirga miroungae]|uniref:Uncharacterized protein n=1 Tax=Oceanivirga miroungae TaxID=1130046 RepID=A0A6I8ME92_9FUSO|nr:hypothetical protein [Oceanivirga miroungae]VWL85411.1 hypothetical protein OMES3154_00696 [Oceanivirga miroungae]
MKKKSKIEEIKEIDEFHDYLESLSIDELDELEYMVCRDFEMMSSDKNIVEKLNKSDKEVISLFNCLVKMYELAKIKELKIKNVKKTISSVIN